jgi:hypothetical protein
MKKKASGVNKLFNDITFAQASALSAVLEKANVPPSGWSEMAKIFSETFQATLNELKSRDNNGHTKEN